MVGGGGREVFGCLGRMRLRYAGEKGRIWVVGEEHCGLRTSREDGNDIPVFEVGFEDLELGRDGRVCWKSRRIIG